MAKVDRAKMGSAPAQMAVPKGKATNLAALPAVTLTIGKTSVRRHKGLFEVNLERLLLLQKLDLQVARHQLQQLVAARCAISTSHGSHPRRFAKAEQTANFFTKIKSLPVQRLHESLAHFSRQL